MLFRPMDFHEIADLLAALTQKTERKRKKPPKQAQKRNFIQELQDSDQLRGVVDVGH
jgi:hypothetical protein